MNLGRHFISGFLSFLIYFFVIFIMFGKFDIKQNIIMHLDSNKNQMDIFSDFDVEESVNVDSIVKNEELPAEVLKEVQTKKDNAITLPKAPKKINLNDMFSNIPSPNQQASKKQKLQDELERQEQLRRAKIQKEESRKKIEAFNNNAKELQKNLQNLRQTAHNANDAIKNLNEVSIAKPSGAEQNNEEFDDWYAKVANITSKWKNEGNYYKDANIIVRVSVDNSGHFQFMYIIKSSGYSDYDNIAVAFLQKLQNITFPIPPNGNRVEFNLSFTSKVNN